MKTIVADKNEIITRAAGLVAELLSRKADAVIAFSWEEELSGLFSALSLLCERGELSLRESRIFAVCELADSDILAKRLDAQLLSRTDARPGNCFFPSAAEPEKYDALLDSFGGLDMAVLGIGTNARIGFNEPATAFETLTHAQKLTNATKRELAALLGEESIPAVGITMGIKTLTLAKTALLLASGEQRAKPVFNLLYGRTDSFYPAAFLQLPAEVTVLADREAGSLL